MLINAQTAAGYALTSLLVQSNWYFWLQTVQKMTLYEQLTMEPCESDAGGGCGGFVLERGGPS